MRTIVISDIHGHLKELQSLLHQVLYSPHKDKLILLGDYMDRGRENKRTIAFIKKLQKENKNVILLKGNHDDSFVSAVNGLYEKEDLYTWAIYNGGYSTLLDYADYRDYSSLEDYIKYIRENHYDDVEFLSNLPLYYEDDKHIYVHAGINPVLRDWKNSLENEFLFIRDRFIYNDLRDVNKIVIFGHTPCFKIKNHEKNEPFFDYRNNALKKIGIDGGMGSRKQLNALIIENGEYTFEYVEDSIF